MRNLKQLCFSVFVATALAADTVYLTDLPAFTSLAPCAAGALSYAINTLTYNKCPPDVSGLASCVCTKDQNSGSVAAQVSKSALSSCDATATEDVSSALAVLSNYCNQAQPATPFPAITNGVTQYITDLAAYSDLGPCASGALSYVVRTMTNQKCPGPASALVSCACLKNQNSLLISGLINKSVLSSCGTTHTEDVASAHAVFAGYCGLNNGTSVFPTPSPLAGSMTYYITDMAEYSSLVPCAKSAVYYQAQYSLTYNNCPKDPNNLASCACKKDGNAGSVVTGIASDVKSSCGPAAAQDVSSAAAVFNLYCNAANGLVTPQGITASVTSTPRSDGGAAAATKTPNQASPGPSRTGTGTAPTGVSASTNSNAAESKTSDSTTTGKSFPKAAIIGIAVGAIVLIIVILFALWRYRKSRLLKKSAQHSSPFPSEYTGKAELASTTVSPVPAKSSIFRKPAPSPGVSPIVQEKPIELQSPVAAYRPGTPGSGTVSAAEMYSGQAPALPPRQAEVQGSSHYPQHEMGARHETGAHYEMAGNMTGPQQTYYEMPHQTWR